MIINIRSLFCFRMDQQRRLHSISLHSPGAALVDHCRYLDGPWQLRKLRVLGPDCRNERPDESRYRARKLDFVLEDIPELISQSLNGAKRVAGIVSDLKGFAHLDDDGERSVDLNREIDRALTMVGHEIPADAAIEKQYGELPAVSCHPALMGQALLSLLTNAFEACPRGLRLRIETRATEKEVELVFTDNGPGIPEALRHRIFDPFFTTKEVGQGTGMGLTVAYDIIRAAGGTLFLESQADRGACFRVRIPREARSA